MKNFTASRKFLKKVYEPEKNSKTILKKFYSPKKILILKKL